MSDGELIEFHYDSEDCAMKVSVPDTSLNVEPCGQSRVRGKSGSGRPALVSGRANNVYTSSDIAPVPSTAEHTLAA